jgi:hypothetical protein
MKAQDMILPQGPGHRASIVLDRHSRSMTGRQAMRLIEADELRQFSEILKNRSCSLDDFELHELDTTDPKSDELSPLKGYVEIRRKSNDVVREYVTGDGTAWVSAFENDLGIGRFG